MGDSVEPRVTVSGHEKVVVNIRCSNGSKFTVSTTLDSTVEAFKAVLSQNCDVPVDQQRLIYKGRILKNDQTLEFYGVQADHTVHLVRGFPQPTSASPPNNANFNNSSTTSSIAGGVGSSEEGGFGSGGTRASLFPGLAFGAIGGNGASGLSGAGLQELEQVQQQLSQNPNMMREIMNMPAIQNLMNDPDTFRNLIMSSPQISEIIDRNPELAHVLNDPGILRQTLEAARNPEIMREMMRNADRAMSNIEASPEGFNMLRRMYENVQEPFLNATTMGGNGGNGLRSNPFAALVGNQGQAQVNNGLTNPSTTGSETSSGQPSPNTNPLPNPWSNTGGSTQSNSVTRTNLGSGRSPSVGGLGGLGLPGREQILNGLPDVSQLNQLLENPAILQTMQSLLLNPQYMNQILSLSPQLRNLVDMNPQLREMMQNPELLRQFTSPERIQQVLGLQQSLLSQDNQQQSTQNPDRLAATRGMPNINNMELLSNMFGGLGLGTLNVPNNPDVTPEELYATQLSQLQEMGFYDPQENIRALQATSGNVHAAVERLLGSPPQ